MMKNSLSFVLLSSLLMASLSLAASESETESLSLSKSVRVSGPILGFPGDRLMISVAVLPGFDCLPSCFDDDTEILIRVYDADATDLAPIAELPRVRVRAGRSVGLDFDFVSSPDLGDRQRVVVRLEAYRTSGRVTRSENFVASVQVVEIATNHNQLWGDWFIVQ